MVGEHADKEPSDETPEEEVDASNSAPPSEDAPADEDDSADAEDDPPAEDEAPEDDPPAEDEAPNDDPPAEDEAPEDDPPAEDEAPNDDEALADAVQDVPESIAGSEVHSISSLPPPSDPSYELGALVARSFAPGELDGVRDGAVAKLNALEKAATDNEPFRLMRSKPPAPPPRPRMKTLPPPLPKKELPKEPVTFQGEAPMGGMAAMAASVPPTKSPSVQPGKRSDPPSSRRRIEKTKKSSRNEKEERKSRERTPAPPVVVAGSNIGRDIGMVAIGVLLTLGAQWVLARTSAPPITPVSEAPMVNTVGTQPQPAGPTHATPTDPTSIVVAPDDSDAVEDDGPPPEDSSRPVGVWPTDSDDGPDEPEDPEPTASAEPEDPEPAPSAEPTSEPAAEAPPFNRAAAKAALAGAAGAASGCGKGEVSGVAQVSVTFARSGRVTSANVSGSLAGTPAGSCVAQAMRSASVPAYSGDIVTVMKRINVR